MGGRTEYFGWQYHKRSRLRKASDRFTNGLSVADGQAIGHPPEANPAGLRHQPIMCVVQ
ncbi:MAG: hypothetical protein HC895_27520 [Leptolyngbyaceae cyanobacterium SM1_3_5]|nr:hypothetical protein [Leptolyngbyaceae cyanobacterium SM1_3_5]